MSRAAAYLRSITSASKDISIYKLRRIADYIEELERRQPIPEYLERSLNAALKESDL